MYILILEDGEALKCDKVQEDDLQGSDDGYLLIIDISGDGPTVYDNGEWKPMESTEKYGGE